VDASPRACFVPVSQFAGRGAHDNVRRSFLFVPQPLQLSCAAKTLKLVAEYDVTVNLRPAYPLAVRVPGFFKRANPQFARYVVLHSGRLAKHENIPFRFLCPDPIVQDMAALEVAEDQPYIHRLTRLGAAAQLEGRSLVFVDAISRVLWDGSAAGWNEGDHRACAAATAGFGLPAMNDAISADPDRYEAIIADNEKADAASGHWGCRPSCSRASRSSDRTASIS
jgi:2-hydroxychromene-2-carboxylate isomerase